MTPYEKRDIDAALIVKAMGILILFTCVVSLITHLVLMLFGDTAKPARGGSNAPTTAAGTHGATAEIQKTQPLPPEPRLQPDPDRGLAELRAEESSLLERYAWVDRARGIVRIPIDRAIELTAERGLPSRRAE